MRSSVLLPLDLMMYRPEAFSRAWREEEEQGSHGSADCLPQKSPFWGALSFETILVAQGLGSRGEGANHSTYPVTSFGPGPSGDSGERGILADQHTCVPLIPMLGLLVRCHLRGN